MTPITLGAMLYRLAFPSKDFWALSEEVQRAYIQDGARLKAMMDEEATSADLR